MRTTIDKAGRIVLPKALRESVGITAGEVEVTVSGSGLLVEPAECGGLEEVDGRLVLAGGGVTMSVDDVRELRLGLQR